MFIVTLLVLTVFLSYTLAGAARDAAVVQLPTLEYGRTQSYKDFARELVLSNRFWIYLVLGIGVTLLVSTSLAIALIMHVKLMAIAAGLLAVGFFTARGLMAKAMVRRRRPVLKLLQLGGACSAMVALVMLLRS